MQHDIVMSASEAVRIIVDCDTIATSGVVGSGPRAARAVALEARFLESGMRRGLTLVHAAGQGQGADRRIFLERRIDLRRASRLTLADRVRYDPGENILFLNFECLTLDTDTDTDAIIRSRIESGSGAMIRSRGGLGFPRRIRRPH